MKPLFMWAGGKTRMIKFYQRSQIMPITVDRYIEPFFGGGAMFLHVMDKYKPRQAIINDINPSIVNIYDSIKNNHTAFTQEVDQLEAQYLPLDKAGRKQYYYDVRNNHAYNYAGWGPVREAATLYFLMKTGFNGIWQINQNTNNRFGTPAGLLNQTTQVYDRAVVQHWHNVLQRTTILSGDWRGVINQYPDQPGSFYYLDPPYRGSITHYGQTFTDVDQADLVAFSQTVGEDSRVILCNDDVGDGFFDTRKGTLNIERYNIVHTAGRRKNTGGVHTAKAAIELALHNARVLDPMRLFEIV
jgi:DNA adenine methylase